MKVCYKNNQCIFSESSYALNASGGRSCYKESTEECPNKNLENFSIWSQVVESDLIDKEIRSKNYQPIISESFNCFVDPANKNFRSYSGGINLDTKEIIIKEEVNYKEKYEILEESIKLLYHEFNLHLNYTGSYINDKFESLLQSNDINFLFKNSSSYDLKSKENNKTYTEYSMREYEVSDRFITTCPVRQHILIGSAGCVGCIHHIDKNIKIKKVWCNVT